MLLEKVRVVLNDIKEEGLENVFKRHNRLARATRAAIEAMGLTMVAPDSPADSATGCFVPEGLLMVENRLKACGTILVSPLRVGKINGKAKLFASHIWVMWMHLMSSSLFQL